VYQKSAKPRTDIKQIQQANYWYDAIAQLVESYSPQLPEVLLQQDIN
jgi:hypothetical protein